MALVLDLAHMLAFLNGAWPACVTNLANLFEFRVPSIAVVGSCATRSDVSSALNTKNLCGLLRLARWPC